MITDRANLNTTTLKEYQIKHVKYIQTIQVLMPRTFYEEKTQLLQMMVISDQLNMLTAGGERDDRSGALWSDTRRMLMG